ncbi:aldehyde dehydrogenase family protein [Yaniella halotolerans]|uniref:aldehyde dehydrogenase family protein n=1 Tax=Yaniella halotolerans TaxID=225453 RepID=UPI0003B6A77B|nr:aldehyde dehydrogenase family protein [Yaniella halotolerans]
MTLDTTTHQTRDTLDLPYRHVTTHFINGTYQPSHGQDTIEVTDPATNTVWGSVPVGNQDDVDAAVNAAHTAFTTGPWAATTPTQRAETLLRIAEEIEARSTELSLTNTLENGSPVAETSGAAANAASIFRYFATLAPELETDDVRPFPASTGESLVRKDPIGVCALIAPWNFPINLMVTKLAPALLAGCTVVMKPASPTPLSFRIIVDAITAAGVPDGVVNLVTGPGRMGDLMVRHPKVAKVAFTGSTPVGRHIAAACGELLRPVTLELGGKSSAIVMEDADLEEMSARLIRSCMRNTGQTCYISTRILAPASRYEDIVDMVTETIAAAPQGDPLDPETVFGPSANLSQYKSVLEHLDSAKAEGARVTTGGGKATGELSDGLFIQPTVLADVTPEMRVAREEIFGPVITIMKYTDLDDAISLANNTEFGLGGLVFGSDQEKALEVADAVDTGSVGINFFASNHAAPFGGRNDSGLGVEYGPEGLAAYLSYKSIHRR